MKFITQGNHDFSLLQTFKNHVEKHLTGSLVEEVPVHCRGVGLDDL